MSRALLLMLTGSPFEAGLNSLMKKVQKALSPKTREFLERCRTSCASARAAQEGPAGYNEMVAQLIEGSTRRRVAEMRYFSVSSNRQKDYVVHPYTIRYSDGGLYLRAYVPEYDELRLFAAERIKKFVVTERLHARQGRQGPTSSRRWALAADRANVWCSSSRPASRRMCASACGTSRSSSRSCPMAAYGSA